MSLVCCKKLVVLVYLSPICLNAFGEDKAEPPLKWTTESRVGLFSFLFCGRLVLADDAHSALDIALPWPCIYAFVIAQR